MKDTPTELGRYGSEGIHPRRPRLALGFDDPDLERAFQVALARRLALQEQLALVLAVSLWATAVVLLPEIHPVDRLTFAISALPPMAAELAGLMLVGRVRTWRAQQVVNAIVNVVGGLTMVAITTRLVGLPELLAPALLLNAIFAFGVVRMGWIAGIAAAIPPLVVFALLAAMGTYPEIGWFSFFIVASGTGVSAFGAWMLESSSRVRWLQERALEEQGQALATEKQKSDDLLHNMLPPSITARLRDDPGVIADAVADASVVFADIVGFTQIGKTLSPSELVSVLNELFRRFDELAARHGLEKIKTIGDGYMAVAGAPEPMPDHAERAVAFGLDLHAAAASVSTERDLHLAMRVGIHSGALVAGVILRSKLAFDLWGDTVNLASQMESHGLPGRVQVSETTARLLPPTMRLEQRGTIEVKGRGPMGTLLIEVDHPTREGVDPEP